MTNLESLFASSAISPLKKREIRSCCDTSSRDFDGPRIDVDAAVIQWRHVPERVSNVVVSVSAYRVLKKQPKTRETR